MKDKENMVVKLGLLFYICSIIGYFYELLIYFIFNGKIFSHGFLNGPWLAIYGIGSLFILLLNKYRDNFLIIFLASFFITGFFEGLSGYLLLKILKIRLWDYTGYFLNINGFVCFLSAFCFGIGGLLVIYLIYPLVEKIVKKIKISNLKRILGLLTIFFTTDLIASKIK